MADVTISSLPTGAPSGNALLPYSQGGNTLAVAASAILQTAGNIGIGTASLSAKLHVYNTSDVTLALDKPTGASVQFQNSTGRSFQIDEYAGALRFLNKDLIEKMTVDQSGNVTVAGNVGIGTTAPNTKLHVNGTVTCTNTVINGVRTLYVSGRTDGNQAISYTAYLQSSNPVKVQCSFNHWSQQEYNATRESYISASPYSDSYYPMLVDDILSRSSAFGGGWSFSRPTTNTNPPIQGNPTSDKLVITKSAGSYVGASYWWIKIEGNATSLNTYST